MSIAESGPTTISLTARDPARHPKTPTVTVPLSMPALLQNPRSKFAHLHGGGKHEGEKKKDKDRDGLEGGGGAGKRRRRRWENGAFLELLSLDQVSLICSP
jgi:hypothetical protein